MFKHVASVLVLAVLVSSTQAEPQQAAAPARIQSRLHFLARQEATSVAPTEQTAASLAPYPAAGFTPAIPFDLPTETEMPSTPPDSTYGPPSELDTTYGPPPSTDETLTAFADETEDLVSQNLLVQPRSKLSSRLRVAPARRARIVEFIRSEPALVYTLD